MVHLRPPAPETRAANRQHVELEKKRKDAEKQRRDRKRREKEKHDKLNWEQER